MKQGLTAADCQTVEAVRLTVPEEASSPATSSFREPWTVLLYHLEAQSGTAALRAERIGVRPRAHAFQVPSPRLPVVVIKRCMPRVGSQHCPVVNPPGERGCRSLCGRAVRRGHAALRPAQPGWGAWGPLSRARCQDDRLSPPRAQVPVSSR